MAKPKIEKTESNLEIEKTEPLLQVKKLVVTANHSIKYNSEIYLTGDIIGISTTLNDRDLEELLKYGELV